MTSFRCSTLLGQHSPLLLALAASLALSSCGTSQELSRSTAKRLIVASEDAGKLFCDPCFVNFRGINFNTGGQRPFAVRLLDLGYIAPVEVKVPSMVFLGSSTRTATSFTVTDAGRSFFGKRLFENPKTGFDFGVFKKKFGEVTGITSNQPGYATAEYTIKVTPTVDIIRDTNVAIDVFASPGLDLNGTKVTVKEQSGKVEYFLIPLRSDFRRYDDGWRYLSMSGDTGSGGQPGSEIPQ